MHAMRRVARRFKVHALSLQEKVDDVLTQQEDKQDEQQRDNNEGDRVDDACGYRTMRDALDDLDEDTSTIKRWQGKQVHDGQGERDDRDDEERARS